MTKVLVIAVTRESYLSLSPMHTEEDMENDTLNKPRKLNPEKYINTQEPYRKRSVAKKYKITGARSLSAEGEEQKAHVLT